jgi:predicted dehydrogenase
MTRRRFLTNSAGVAALRPAARSGPNDTVRVACVGLRGPGGHHIRSYAGLPNVEIAALCDVDESVHDRRLKELDSTGRKVPAAFIDFRDLLEDKSIDAVSLATPNHWHALQAIWACQAGKDVFVEKPCSHNLFESRQIVAAARKYGRIVQHGAHNRSHPAIREAAEQIREGVIGEVYMARGLCFKWRNTIGRTPPEPVPPGVHYDLWLGPAPRHEFTRNHFHYNWHWFWDYGNGDLGNQGIHQMDICRWLLGVRYPARVSSMGSRFMFDDDQETPNTQTAVFEFDEARKTKLLVFEVRHWISNHEAGIEEKGSPNTIGAIIYGSEGYMVIHAGGYRTYLGREQRPGPARSERGDHFANFIHAVRSRKPSELNAGIEEGAISCDLVHLANISCRLNRTLQCDPAGRRCLGDDEANRMFTRKYRDPFIVPAKV